jgi:photosystem II stability/assembly factor-like uncharacterized protein
MKVMYMKYEKIHLLVLISCIFIAFLFGCQNEDTSNQVSPTESSYNVSSVSYSLGPYGGRIDHIAASTHDARFILSSSSEHAFLTKDGGSQWDLVPLENSRICSLSFHPFVDSTCYILDQDALFVSTDFGKTWIAEKMSDQMLKPFYQLEVHPNGSLFVSCSTGLFVQEEPLSDWEQIFVCHEGEAPLEIIAIDQTDEKHICAISGGKNVYQTKDKGLSWDKNNAFVFQDRLLTDIAIHPSSSNFIAVLYPGGVICSLDKGETWGYETTVKLTSPAYVLALTKVGTMYVGTQNGVWQSLDQGYTWSYIPSLQESVYAIEMGFADQTIFAGTNQNFYSYSLSDQKWGAMSEGISTNPVKDFSIHPIESEQIMVVKRNDEVLKVFRPFEEWSSQSDSYSFYIGSPKEPLEWFGVHNNDIFKSEDSGKNWKHYSSISSSSVVHKIWIHPQNSLIWFAGTKEDKLTPGDGLWISKDEGIRWEKVDNVGGDYTIQTLCFDPVAENVVYSIGNSIFGEKKLFKSEDHGTTWRVLQEDTSLQWIEADGRRSGFVWGITSDGKCMTSSDFGETWNQKIDFSTDYPTAYFAYPSGFQITSTQEEGSCILHLYRGLFFHISDAGESYVPIDGIPDASFYTMQMHPKKKNVLYIASGLGLIECTLDKRMTH